MQGLLLLILVDEVKLEVWSGSAADEVLGGMTKPHHLPPGGRGEKLPRAELLGGGALLLEAQNLGEDVEGNGGVDQRILEQDLAVGARGSVIRVEST